MVETARLDTVYNGKPQKMVLPNGVPKGMKLVLQERGIDVSKMKADGHASNITRNA